MAEDHFGIVGTVQAGAYRVEAVVAEGGFGVVYRAHHDAFQAPVALKCLKMPQQLSAAHQQEFLAKFREEAALLFRLSASIPSVVRPLHVDQLVTPDNRFVPFMALEWLEGEGLDQLIARRDAEGRPPLTMKRAVRLLTPVARALARAHHFPAEGGAISIVHRDLKPDNIFLARVNGEEVVKIFDFGIAKARSVASQVAGRLSQGDAMTAFTPGYGAPEQWLPKRYGQTGPWTDVFGLALTLLELCLGRAVIDGDTAAMMGTACDEARRPSPRTEGLEVSDEVESVFLGALAVDPRKRYLDAGSFWDALESSLGLEVSATPTIAGSMRRDARVDGGAGGPSEERLSTRPPPRVDKFAPTLDAGDARAAASSAPPPGSSPAPSVRAPAPAAPLVLPNIPDIDMSAPPPTPPPRRPSGEREAAPASAPAAPVKGPDFDDEEDGAIEIAVDLKKNADKAKDAPPLRLTGGEPLPTPRVAPAGASGQFPKLEPQPLRVVPRQSAAAKLKIPFILGGSGLLLMLLEQIYVAMVGGLLAVGPIRLTYVAGLLVAAAVVMVVARLVTDDR